MSSGRDPAVVDPFRVFDTREQALEWFYSPVSAFRGRTPHGLFKQGEIETIIEALATTTPGPSSERRVRRDRLAAHSGGRLRPPRSPHLHAAGRWNRAGEYGALYTATSPETVRAEYEKQLRRNDLGIESRRDLVAIKVAVSPVLDLTKRSIRTELGVTKALITGDAEENQADPRSGSILPADAGTEGLLPLSLPLPGSGNSEGAVPPPLIA